MECGTIDMFSNRLWKFREWSAEPRIKRDSTPGARDEEKERDVRCGENRGRNLSSGGKAGGKSENDIPASY